VKITPAAKTGFAATAAVLAGISMTACQAKEADSDSASGDGAQKAAQITVDASDTECKLSGTTATTGPSTFVVTNNGNKVTEFYVYGEGERVMGEVENISPGLKRQLIVQLTQPGTYQTSCRPGMVGEGIRGNFEVTGLQPDADALADQLLADVKELEAGVKAPDWTIDSTQIAGGAQGLLDEIAMSKISGEEDIFSHTDLWDFRANVEGSQTAVASVRPILDERDAELGKRVDARFADVEKLLEKYRDGDGFVSYDKVTEPQRQELSRAIDALSKEVSQVQGVIAKQ
jgi:iron uptake system EfeUOB component EfeO/EfeM